MSSFIILRASSVRSGPVFSDTCRPLSSFLGSGRYVFFSHVCARRSRTGQCALQPIVRRSIRLPSSSARRSSNRLTTAMADRVKTVVNRAGDLYVVLDNDEHMHIVSRSLCKFLYDHPLEIAEVTRWTFPFLKSHREQVALQRPVNPSNPSSSLPRAHPRLRLSLALLTRGASHSSTRTRWRCSASSTSNKRE